MPSPENLPPCPASGHPHTAGKRCGKHGINVKSGTAVRHQAASGINRPTATTPETAGAGHTAVQKDLINKAKQPPACQEDSGLSRPRPPSLERFNQMASGQERNPDTEKHLRRRHPPAVGKQMKSLLPEIRGKKYLYAKQNKRPMQTTDGQPATPKDFCTCPVDKCPRHPKNHAHGCDPCILDNLRRGKMPACFFRVVSDDLDDARDFTIQGFVDFFHRHQDEYKEKFSK